MDCLESATSCRDVMRRDVYVCFVSDLLDAHCLRWNFIQDYDCGKCIFVLSFGHCKGLKDDISIPSRTRI
jgi:hypothetical protein